MDKKMIISAVAAIVVLAGLFLFLTSNKPAVPATSGVIPGGNGAQGPIECGDDSMCLRANFIACSPARFTMPFIQGDYDIEVLGIEDGKCHYTMATFASETDCSLPKELMTADRYGHLFGEDKSPGKEQVLAEQNTLDSTYCAEIPKEVVT